MEKAVAPTPVPGSWSSRLRYFVGKHRKVVIALLVGAVLFVALSRIGFEPLKNVEAGKQYILSFGTTAPVFFIGLQVVQVLIAPLPGQAAGLAGGYVFGWKAGILYTIIGLAIGSWIVFFLSRKLGRAFVEKINGREALRDFEGLFLPKEGTVGNLVDRSYRKSKESGLATFFMIMLLPALPDDLVCFIGGLTKIPIWQLMIATIAGRFPGMLVLSMVGDGASKAQSQLWSGIFIGVTVILTLIYMWKKDAIEAAMRKRVGLHPAE
jgi:uncharacterized membrane protein YdjX (TVP38/TMEM64 family)